MNIQQIMAQAQKMKKDIDQKKNEIDHMSFTGKSEWIKIVFKGDRNVEKVEILNDAVFDPENKEILCDMISLAVKDGLTQIDNTIEEKMGAYTQMNGLF